MKGKTQWGRAALGALMLLAFALITQAEDGAAKADEPLWATRVVTGGSIPLDANAKGTTVVTGHISDGIRIGSAEAKRAVLTTAGSQHTPDATYSDAAASEQPELVVNRRDLRPIAAQIVTASTQAESRAAISQSSLRAIVVELSSAKYAGREYGTQGDIDARNYVKSQLKAAGLSTVYGTWQQFFKLNNKSTANVWAQLSGTHSTLKNEIIIVSAHHDHLGNRCFGTGTFCPGANDDATGVAAVIELARAVAKVRKLLKKTVVFITFGAEEQGYAGAKYYLAHPPYPLDKTIFMMDFDMLGLNYPNVTTWSTSAKSARVNLWFNQAFNGVYDDTDSAPWISWEAQYGDELDAVVFRQAGVPNRAWWNYDPYNHTKSDTAYRLNYSVMAETVRMIFDFIMKLATDTTARAPSPMY